VSTVAILHGVQRDMSFLPATLDHQFGWLHDVLGYDLTRDEPDPVRGRALRRYAGSRTVVQVRVIVFHGCSADVSLGVPGDGALIPMTECLRARGLALPPSRSAFQAAINLCSRADDDFGTCVAGALEPYAAALRQLEPYELAGNWSL
jgi:hypothetical protein